MPFALGKLGELTNTLIFVYEHDTGVVEERITYRPLEVDRPQVRIEYRKNDNGNEEIRTIFNNDNPPDGWNTRPEWVYEWLDRVVVGKLPFTDTNGKLLTASELWNHNDPRIQQYRFLLREIENQIRQHMNPLARSLMEIRHKRLGN